ncbi:uncharacterized protein LTR77_003338 [Saxophila tyrrhenica]|uniref:Calcineurin-like phosphoesterase domain-containing protein n=1 Tax=Saxophila tyrrhenica TaxID=1690608 RepID=A0AAV9PHC8_9PEZI|nr:hypothetical protein LTR77_003338 [Saxophila tyrrhenica]
MTRRITRTLGQLAAFLVLIFFLLFIADSRYRVLPNSLHSHFPSHHAGTVITDISIAFCSSANPFSSCRLDADEWHRVEKDLYLHNGWLSSAWLHVKRKKEGELKAEDQVVVDIRIARLDPGTSEKEQEKERWESRPGGVWILRSSKRHDSESERVVTAVDVLFGADAVDPRTGWQLSSTPLLVDSGDLPARLSVRHGQPHLPKEVVPRVRKDGRFKILQVSDAHLSTGTGICRDAIGPDNKPSPNCEADVRTLDFLETLLDDEKPDLVILSGDQVEGPSAPDTQSALFKLVAPLIERNIPYASIFGNHDDEGARSLSRTQQMALLQTLPGNLAHPGPAEVDGVGNYYLEIQAEKSQHSALTIYLLDSHSLTPDEKNYRGYDWIKPSQISWFKTTAEGLKKEHAKYSHIHMDMAFIHIPLPEFADRENNKVVGGEWRESVTAPAYNSHFYDALADHRIVAVGAGHDHVNDYCAINPHPSPAQSNAEHSEHHHTSGLGPWMCYAGGSGFGGYAGYGGFHRRMRVWEVDAQAGRLSTWTRVECCSAEERGERKGEVVLVEGGGIVAPS